MVMGAAEPADAIQRISAGQFAPAIGPRLGGETVLWIQPTADGGFVLKRGALSGGEPESVIRTRGRRGYAPRVRLIASETQVILQRALVEKLPPPQGPSEIVDLGTNRLLGDGRLERLAPAAAGVGAFSSRDFDVTRDTVIFPSGSRQATVRDFGSGGAQDRRIDGVGSNLRISGRYAAWVDSEGSGDVVVYDHQQGSEVYRVVAGTSLPGGQLDLQEDGKVAFTYQASPDKSALAWASPQAPVLHPLPVAARRHYWLKLAGDTVAFERSDGRGGELGIVPLSGPERILVRPVLTPNDAEELFDFDGTRVAWLTERCNGFEVRHSRLDELLRRPNLVRRRQCPLRLRRRPTVDRRGNLILRLSCVGFERGCTGVRFSLRTARAYRVGARRLARGTPLRVVRRSAGRDGGVRLRLEPTGRRLLRQAGPVRLKVAALIFDLETGERRRTTILVR